MSKPAHGGILQVAQRAEPRTFNPVMAIDAPSRDVLRRMNGDLIRIDRLTQKTAPSLAERWTQSKDGRTFVLHLRPGTRFSDGTPFTSEDVLFSFAVYQDERVASPQRDLLLVHGQPVKVRALGPATVEVQVAEPYAAAERLFDSVAMLPRHRLERPWKDGKLREAWGVGTPPGEMAGLGPFRLKEYRPGEMVVLERNPHFWRRDLPYLDEVRFRFVADEEAQIARFAAGEIDILNRVPAKSIAYLQSKGKAVADLGPGLEYNFLCFNLSSGSARLAWFGRLEFRQALSLSVDRRAMASLIFNGRAAPIWGNVSPGNRLWYAEKLVRPARSVAGARLLLTAAGFRWDSSSRLLDSNGQRVEFTIAVSASSAERNRMATMLQADWAELGIAINIVPLEFRTLLDRVLNTRQFDAALMGLGGGDADPNPEMNVWLSTGAMHLWNPNQKQPGTPWEAEIDRLMKQQMITLVVSERKAIYDRVQTIVAEQAPFIFLVSPHTLVAQGGAVGNFRPAVMDHQTLWNADELYLQRGGATAR